MKVDFTPEQEAQLAQIALHAGTDAEHFVKDAALRAVEETIRFRAAVRLGIAEADRGELIDDDEIRVWLEQQKNSVKVIRWTPSASNDLKTISSYIESQRNFINGESRVPHHLRCRSNPPHLARRSSG